MKKIKKSWIIPLLFTIVIIVAGSLYIGSMLMKEEPLSKEEIRSQLEVMYGGKVESLAMKNGIYIAKIARSGALYSAQIDGVTGRVMSLNQLSEMEEESLQVLSEDEIRKVIAKTYTGEIKRISLNKNVESPIYQVEVVKNQGLVKIQLDAFSGEVISEAITDKTAENALITKERAIEIALEQLPGEVEYVTFEQTDSGGYYLVEIEQDNENGDDLEAVFQIHAITGEILSVKWDD